MYLSPVKRAGGGGGRGGGVGGGFTGLTNTYHFFCYYARF